MQVDAIDTRSRRAEARAAFGVAVAVALSLLVGAVGGARPAAAADPGMPSLVTGWIPSWSTGPGLAGVEANANIVGEASPFWYSAKASSGRVSISSSIGSTSKDKVLTSLRSRGIKVIPSIADSSSARAMAAVLKDSADRKAHVSQLVDLVTDNSYDGIELDYEKFAFSDGRSTWASTRPAWVQFITQLGEALHARGKLLALAVPPMYDADRDSSSGYWVYDYAGIAPVVDSLRIMTYDYSVSRPGPIAPLSFVRRTLDFAVTAFPAERIRMGVPAYGRLWVARRADGSMRISGTCPTSGVRGTSSFTTASARTFLTSVAGSMPTVRFDDTAAEATTTFTKKYTGKGPDGTTTTCTVTHEAWWMDGRGVAARLPYVTSYGLAGAAIWHLGGADGAMWAAAQAFAGQDPEPKGEDPEPKGEDPGPTMRDATVTVKASTLRPKKGAKVTIRVKVRPATKKVLVKRQMLVDDRWRTLAKKRTNAKGNVTFKVRWPRKGQTTNTYRIVTSKRGTLAAGASETFTIRTR